MDPNRKRTTLVVALAAALLGGALVHAGFSAASEARRPWPLRRGPAASIAGVPAGRANRRRLGARAVYAQALVLTTAFAVRDAPLLRSDVTF